MSSIGTLVNWCTSDQSGAPQITNAASGILTVLKALLTNTGFGSKSIDSITRSGSTATVTVSAGHGLLEDQVALIAGADQSEYNGPKKLFNVTNTTYQFTVSGTPASGTGSMTMKWCGLGWDNPYSGTDTEVFKSGEGSASGIFLRLYEPSTLTIDRSNAGAVVSYASNASMLMEMYSAMSAHSTGTLCAKGWMPRYRTSNLGVRYVFVGDGKRWYLFKASKSEANSFYWLHRLYAFGDFVNPNVAAGQRAFMLSKYGWSSSTDDVMDAYNDTLVYGIGASAGTNPPMQFPLDVGGGNTSRQGTIAGAAATNADEVGTGLTAPGYFDQGRIYTQLYAQQTENVRTIRGRMPGLHNPHALCPSQYTYSMRIPGVAMADASSRTMLLVGMNNGSTTVMSGTYAIDITGPWE